MAARHQRGTAPLDERHAAFGVVHEGTALNVDNRLDGAVVILSVKIAGDQIHPIMAVGNATVEVEQIGAVFINQVEVAAEPFLFPGFRGLS